MNRRWCTSHTKDAGGRRLLGLTFNMEERKRRNENIHRHSDKCMLGWSDMLAEHLKHQTAHFSK